MNFESGYKATVFVYGLGHVGRALLGLLAERKAHPELLVCGVADSSGCRVLPEGFSACELARLEKLKEEGFRLSDPAYDGLGSYEAEPGTALGRLKPTCLAELGPTRLDADGPDLRRAEEALAAGSHLVYASKGVLAASWDRLMGAVSGAGRRVRYSATVGAGMPVLDTGKIFGTENPLERIEAVLNGTSVYLLSRMEDGLTFEAALAEAQAAGIAESDPSADVEGFDAAAKLCILSRAVMGLPLALGDVRRDSLRLASPERLHSAQAHGARLRAVGRLERVAGAVQASVSLEEVPDHSPLARRGVENAVLFSSATGGQLGLTGLGAGPSQTATAVLRDLAILAGKCPLG